MSLAKATAGDILYLLCFALWISRGCIRLADAIKGDRERALIKPLNRRPTREVDLRSTLSGLRYTALVLEIAGAASCFLGCLAFFFTSKTQGVVSSLCEAAPRNLFTPLPCRQPLSACSHVSTDPRRRPT